MCPSYGPSFGSSFLFLLLHSFLLVPVVSFHSPVLRIVTGKVVRCVHIVEAPKYHFVENSCTSLHSASTKVEEEGNSSISSLFLEIQTIISPLFFSLLPSLLSLCFLLFLPLFPSSPLSSYTKSDLSLHLSPHRSLFPPTSLTTNTSTPPLSWSWSWPNYR